MRIAAIVALALAGATLSGCLDSVDENGVRTDAFAAAAGALGAQVEAFVIDRGDAELSCEQLRVAMQEVEAMKDAANNQGSASGELFTAMRVQYWTAALTMPSAPAANFATFADMRYAHLRRLFEQKACR